MKAWLAGFVAVARRVGRGWGAWWQTCLAFLVALSGSPLAAAGEAAPKKVVILPIREDIMPPLVYLVRRGVKEAMDAQADLLVLDMETNGGRLDSTEAIFDILSQFKGETVTYVNRNAYSAGAFIAMATQKIYMAPESVIGAAAPIMLSPGGMGVQDIPSTLQIKMNSAISAKVRAYAQKNGHNPDVIEAMIDPQKELKMDGKVLNEKGHILTLTNREAERDYGTPPRPLLSLGTVPSLESLLAKLGYAHAQQWVVTPMGAEKLATWINALDWLWLIIGIAGIYLEFKTPGFGLPLIAGMCAFGLYFFGSYIAGLAGWEWPLLFLVGLVLVGIELFVLPGTVAMGLGGTALMALAILMAMVDTYPGMPVIPSLPQLRLPLRELGFSLLGALVLLVILSQVLPKTSVYGVLVSQSASGVRSVEQQRQRQAQRLGEEGVALSPLRPGGKARFGDELLDVMTQGDMIVKGTRVRIIGHSGREAIVEAV